MVELPSFENWKRGEENDLTIIRDCYCPNCGGGQGVTTMLPTQIPAFREIIVMNLCCDECGFRSSEVNFGGEIKPQGERLSLMITSPNDLDRQIVKSDSASLLIPSLELEIPPVTQRGTVSTIEGFLQKTAEALEELQPERLRLGDLDNFHRCRRVIHGLRRFMSRNPWEEKSEEEEEEEDHEGAAKPGLPFLLILDDPAGNSFIENPNAPYPDPNLTSDKYFRTPSQDLALGLQPAEKAMQDGILDDNNPDHKNPVNVAKGYHGIEKLTSKKDGEQIGREEVMVFPSTCANCHQPAETKMCVTDVPHFKEIIIMSMLCDHCGFKSNEIKGGGAIPKYGCKITVSVKTGEDLAREVLKSDTAGVAIPELELELNEGGLDGMYTTIEGVLEKIHDRLRTGNPFGAGDSAIKQHSANDGQGFSDPSPSHVQYMKFLANLKEMAAGRLLPFTLIITDPLANSFVGPPGPDAVALALQAEKDGSNKCYEDYVDPGMVIEEYERTFQQNEDLGLNDIKTENYRIGVADGGQYYGTDEMQEVPDRIRYLDVRGPDHPHEVGKAPVEGDTTVMGAKSLNFAVPGMVQRGTRTAAEPIAVNSPEISNLLHQREMDDRDFIMSDTFDGSRPGYVFKLGAQGQGYYKDIPLVTLWESTRIG